MKILSIDTSSKICGVSILENTQLLCNLDKIAQNTHSVCLMPMIKKALEHTDLQLKDIDLIVCDIGPGSFTGIRIGIATTKGFHDSLNIPCVGISSLEALAYHIFLSQKDVYVNNINIPNKKDFSNYNNNLICSILDCKHENCYFALYQNLNNNLTELIVPKAESVQDALHILKDYCEKLGEYFITFVGDGSENFKEQISKAFPYANFATSDENNLNSYFLGYAGFSHYKVSKKDENILPLYLKNPAISKKKERK